MCVCVCGGDGKTLQNIGMRRSEVMGIEMLLELVAGALPWLELVTGAILWLEVGY